MTEARKIYMTEYITHRRNSFRLQGLCTECGKETDGLHTRCERCRTLNAKCQARWRDKQYGRVSCQL